VPVPVPVPALRPASPGPPPLDAAQPFAKLAVPGFGEAVVSLPLGATTRRPIALALHGNFDRPEWQCEVWRRITGGEVFVLCPRGIPRRDVPKELDRWEWGSLAKTKAELVAALAAVRARYPEHVSEGPVVFTGFSLGAILGASLIRDPELGVGAAVLTEGGYQGWTLPKAKALRPTLRRVLFACGQTDCRNAYRYQLEKLFERAELPSAMVADVKAGHTYDASVAELIRAEWPGLLAALDH
jgi:predicted esterase